MSTVIELGSRAGIGDGYRRNLPLEHDLAEPIEVDARRLGPCHPMFLVRLRIFLDWHAAAGRVVSLRLPADADVRALLAEMGELCDNARVHGRNDPRRLRRGRSGREAATVVPPGDRGSRHRHPGAHPAPAENALIRARSAARIDIRSAGGRVWVDLVHGTQKASGHALAPRRRGTWITYTVISI